MRRVQRPPASSDPDKKEQAPPPSGSRGTLARPSSFAAVATPFNAPAKRRGADDADVTHGSTNAAPATVVNQEIKFTRDTVVDQTEVGDVDVVAGAAVAATAATPIISELKEDVDVTRAVAIIEDICEELEADTVGLAEADGRLSSLSTAALLAAAPFKHPKEREAVFEVSPCSLLRMSSIFACTRHVVSLQRVRVQVARKLWNMCVARTNALMTDVHDTAKNPRDDFPLAQSEALGERKAAAAAVTLLRSHCCNLLEASLCNLATAAGQPQVRVQDAQVGLAFMSKVCRQHICPSCIFLTVHTLIHLHI